jgi:hypothetical protein
MIDAGRGDLLLDRTFYQIRKFLKNGKSEEKKGR